MVDTNSISLCSACVLVALAVSCSSSDEPDASVADSGVVDSGSPADAGIADSGTPDIGPVDTGAICSDPVLVSCTDESILELALHDTVNSGVIVNQESGGTWVSIVDAAAGGMNPTESFVYAKVTETGLINAGLSDEDAFDSMDWDLAFRRYLIRLNGGISGPSCVAGVKMPSGVGFDDLDSVPTNLNLETESYMTASCDVIPDTSGLGSPATVTSDFWTYGGCVQMTGNVYVIRTASGRHIKLTIDAYYSPTVQAHCDQNGSLPGGPTGSGTIRARWALLP